LSKSPFCGQEYTFKLVPKVIHERDGMFNAEINKAQAERHYFWVGSSALRAMRTCLAAATIDENSVLNILDYACGYGRVLRWIKAHFRSAHILGVDADSKAAQATMTITNVETASLDTSLSKPLSNEKFDLIWVGSLFTHLPEEESHRVLQYLAAHLRGVLVVSTYSPRNDRKLQGRLTKLKLSIQESAQVLREYDTTGYAYRDYHERKGYGLSFINPVKFIDMAKTAQLKTVFFRDQYWAKRQDIYGFVPASDSMDFSNSG
jgi:2-polyprenyl-3-methyl-5-hydroxy-6-metoxy-1,4-benzoquinol methylase